jgi:hypothetical protein
MRLGMLCGITACGLVCGVSHADDALPLATLTALKDATVYIKVGSGGQQATGSGFLIKVDGENGYVVTNFHVIAAGQRTRPGVVPRLKSADDRTVSVVFASGTRRERAVHGEVIAADHKADLAIVKVWPVESLPKPIDWNQAAEMSETMSVYALGFPLGQMLATGKGGPAISVTKGSITSLRRDDQDRIALVQIDSELNPGNSGGPVVDGRGHLVGIATAKVKDTRIGLAIPPRELAALMDGRVGDVHLEMTGVNEARAEVDLIDPIYKVRSVKLRFVRATVVNNQLGSESLADVEKSQEVVLKRDGIVAAGTFTFEMRGSPEVYLVAQVTSVGGDGKTVVSERSMVVLQSINRPANVARNANRDPAPPPVAKIIRPVPRNRADEIARAKPLADEAITRALENLLDAAKAGPAADMLARARPDPKRREEVAEVLRPMVNEANGRFFIRLHAIRALARWGTEKDVELLLPLLTNENAFLRAEAIEALSWLGGADAAKAMVERAGYLSDRIHVIRGLERMGRVVEDVVASAFLESEDTSLRLEGCKLMQTIGTEQSLKALQARAGGDESQAVRQAAEKAVQEIQHRGEAAPKK